MVHVGKERYWSVVDKSAEDVAGKLSYSSPAIVEVKVVSAMDKELPLKDIEWERELR
jgi:hypothetical protein